MNPNIVFVVLSLAVTANSNTLSTPAVNETPKLAVANTDTTHGEEGKRLLRTNNRKTDIFDEERAGTSRTPLEALMQVQGFEKIHLSNSFGSEEKIIRFLQHTSPETKKIIDNSNIDIKEVLAKTRTLLADPSHSVDGWETNFYKALGGEYFPRNSNINFPDAPPTMNDPSGKNLEEMVARATDYFKRVRVDPDEVMKKAFWLHENKQIKLDNQKIFNMAYGGEYFAKKNP